MAVIWQMTSEDRATETRQRTAWSLRPQAVRHGRWMALWLVLGPWLLVEAVSSALLASLLDPFLWPYTWGVLVMLALGLPVLVLGVSLALAGLYWRLTPLERVRSRLQDCP